MITKPKKVKHVNELPDWFCLEKYNDLKSFDANDWYKSLFIRQSLLKAQNSKSYKKALKSGKDLACLFKKDLDSLRLNPLSNDNDFFIITSSRFYPHKELGVRPITIFDIYNEIKYIEEDKQEYAKKIIINTDDTDSFLNAIYRTKTKKEWKVNPLNEALSNRLIHINLELPEKILIEQFTAYIKKNQYKRSRKKPDFQKLINFGVLPYLDLKIWELESKISIPNSVLANAIFPPYEGGEEMVRKTTTKIANEVITLEYILFLESYSSNEKAEQEIK